MNRVFIGPFKFKANYKHCQMPDLALRTKAKEQNVKKTAVRYTGHESFTLPSICQLRMIPIILSQ